MTARLLLGVAMLSVVPIACSCSSDYSSEVRQTMTRVLKQDFPRYQFWATPVGNFGIGTMYLKSAAQQNSATIPDNALIAIPDTYFSSTVGAQDRPTILAKLFPDGAVGSFQVDEKLTSGVSLNVAVPNISGLIGLSGGVDANRDVSVGLHADKARARKTNWTELARAMRAGQIADDIKAHILVRDVIIAMNDVVLEGYKASVHVNTKTNPNLDAALTNAALKKEVGDATAKFKITKTQDGTYEIEIAEPVVVATLFREIPAGVLEAQDANTFPIVDVRNDNFEQMRRIVSERLRTLIR